MISIDVLRILRRVERVVGVSLRLVSLVSAPLGVSLRGRLGCLGRHCVYSSLHLRLSVKGLPGTSQLYSHDTVVWAAQARWTDRGRRSRSTQVRIEGEGKRWLSAPSNAQRQVLAGHC